MIKKVFFSLMIIFLIICSINTVQAISFTNIINGADEFINLGDDSTPISGDELKGLSDSIYNVLLIIGTIIAVIVGAILGIQFITGSVEQKSKVKETLIPYFVGCAVIFGAFGIWKLVIEILRQVS